MNPPGRPGLASEIVMSLWARSLTLGLVAALGSTFLGACATATPSESACDCTFESDLADDPGRCGPAKPVCNANGYCAKACRAVCVADSECQQGEVCWLWTETDGTCLAHPECAEAQG